MVSEVFIYVYDVRSLVWCDRECWNVTRCFTYKCRYLGIHDAPIKIQGPYQIQGPWLGSTLHTSDDLEVMLSQEKWYKMKGILKEVVDILSSAGKLQIKGLLSHQIFLVYCTRT